MRVIFGAVMLVQAFALAMPVPDVYIPYENDSGSYGSGSTSNPAWYNIGTTGPEPIHYIGPSTSVSFPQVALNGLKGDYLDISSFGNVGIDPIQSHCYYQTTGVVPDAFSGAQSLTCTFWIRDFLDSSTSLPSAYVWHQFGVPVTALKYRGDQNRVQLRWNNQDCGAGDGWAYSNYGSVESTGQWIFVAVTVDTISDTITFYTGEVGKPVSEQGTFTGLSLTALPALSGQTSADSFCMHGWAYSGTDKYCGYDLDEFRIYASSSDASGALSMEEIEAIRRFDVGTYCGAFDNPYPPGDLNKDCSTDLWDFNRLAQNWQINTMNSTVSEMRTYEVYEPTITRAFISNAATDPLQHNNGPGITFYRGLFYATWYGGEENYEAAPGQRIFVSTSPDAVNWTEPFSFTPRMPSSIQWQPGLINYNNDQALWCFWTHHFGSGIYFSFLGNPQGNWISLNVLGKVTLGDAQYNPFVSGNPIVLESGRIIVPIILQEDGVLDWYLRRKYATTLYSDNGGMSWTWNQNGLVQTPGNIYSIWENTYIQQYDGQVRMFARNNDATTAEETLVTAVGDPNAENFEPSSFSATRTIRSRPGTHQTGQRYYMFHCDNPSIVSWRDDRMNLALYCSRSGKDDFVAGVPIINDEPTLVYPQGHEHDGKLYVIYCGIYDNLPLHVKVATMDPAPDPQKYYIFPRSEVRNLTDNDPAQTEKRITHITENGKDHLLFYGNASAGLDMDIVEPDASTINLVLPVYIESSVSGEMIRLLTVGDKDIILGYDRATYGKLQLCVDGIWQPSCDFDATKWNHLIITVNHSQIVVRNGQSVSVHSPAESFSGRVYLGDGFPDQFLDENSRFYVDVKGLFSRVQANDPQGVCGDILHGFPVADVNYDCRVDGDDARMIARDWLTDTFEE